MSSMSRPHVPAVARHLLLVLATVPALALAQSSPAISTIVAFSNSAVNAGPVRGPDGALYGTTSTVTAVTGGLIYRAAADGSSVRTLYQLKLTDGLNPLGGLLLGSDGLLYGTTSSGTAAESATTGTVFRIAPDGSGFTILHRFQRYTGVNVVGSPINNDGANPESELVEGSDGYLYGVARAGGPNGTGVVYKLQRDGTGLTVLHAFGPVTSDVTVYPPRNADGAEPSGRLVEGADGYFYGTASSGGENASGTVFRVRFDGTDFQTLHVFSALTAGTTGPSTNTDGARPIAGVTDGQDGRLYGVASLGGSLGYGTVFALDPVGGVFTPLHQFNGNLGSGPTGELLLAQNGSLIGTTTAGGTNASGNLLNAGTIFSIARDGTGFTSLHSFDGSKGAVPTGQLLQLGPSTIVGVTTSGGRCSQGTLYNFSLTGATVDGNTSCGQKKNKGSGSTGPAILLLLGTLGLLRRLRSS